MILSILCKITYLRNQIQINECIVQSLFSIRPLSHQLCHLEICPIQLISPLRTLPTIPGHLHQTITQHQNQNTQTPSIGSGRRNGLDLVPVKSQLRLKSDVNDQNQCDEQIGRVIYRIVPHGRFEFSRSGEFSSLGVGLHEWQDQPRKQL